MQAGICLVVSALSILALPAPGSGYVSSLEDDKAKSRHLRRGGGRNAGPPGDPAEVDEPAAEHIEQTELYDLVAAGMHDEAFERAFEAGDELFETEFNLMDGVGAYVGEAFHRFSRVPRADLTGPGEWANHVPARVTGPNAQACNSCHSQPSDDGAGNAAANVHRDPTRGGLMHQFITRNTPHVFAPGALQRLAEEMTDALHAARERARGAACASGGVETLPLEAKGVSFGFITAMALPGTPCDADFDLSGVEGVDLDLVIRPFQWKGNTFTLRDFNRGAAHNELGMQAVEIAGDGVDGDWDGVADELTVGDITALTVYLAAQPRPTTKLELEGLGLIPRLSRSEKQAIARGQRLFSSVGCDSCHKPTLRIADPIFSEPSQNAAYRDALFPAGQDPLSRLVDPDFPVTFDLTQDQPDNVIELRRGGVYRLGSLRTDRSGSALVELFGDLKLHEMGPDLAETVDETGTGRSVWLTKELWGVGSTGPWLHDGRATTLTEAILAHGGEAEDERQAFETLSLEDMQHLVSFLESLVLFKLVEPD